MLEPGDEAPDFELENQNGETVRLSDFEGHVVVYFYPRADTPGCTAQACSFRDNWDEYASRDVPVLGVSDDPVSDLAAFAEKYDLPVELLSDGDASVARRYDSYGEVRYSGEAFDAVLRNTFVVRDGVVEAVYEGVDPEGHAEEVLEALD